MLACIVNPCLWSLWGVRYVRGRKLKRPQGMMCERITSGGLLVEVSEK